MMEKSATEFAENVKSKKNVTTTYKEFEESKTWGKNWVVAMNWAKSVQHFLPNKPVRRMKTFLKTFFVDHVVSKQF